MSPRRLWERLSARDRRAVGLGALALAPALLWVSVLSPYLDALTERQDRLEAERTALAAEWELLASGDRYPRAVRAAAQELKKLAPRLLDGRSEGIAAAELAQLVEDRARASRVHLTRVEPEAVRRVESHLMAVPVALQGESDLEGLLTLLEALEGAETLIRVEDLQVRRRGGAPAGARSGVEVLAFSLRVEGFARASEEEPPAVEGAAP